MSRLGGAAEGDGGCAGGVGGGVVHMVGRACHIAVGDVEPLQPPLCVEDYVMSRHIEGATFKKGKCSIVFNNGYSTVHNHSVL